MTQGAFRVARMQERALPHKRPIGDQWEIDIWAGRSGCFSLVWEVSMSLRMSAGLGLGRFRWRSVVALVVIAWLGIMVALAGFLAASQARARRDVAQRLEARVASGAEFSSLYVRDIFTRERRQAATWLAAGQASALSLVRASGAVGFSAAVLLDHHGRVLQAVPAKPGLVGQVITGRYPHLAAAVAGRAAVSNVVLSAARGVPVVALRCRSRPRLAGGCSVARSMPRPPPWAAT